MRTAFKGKPNQVREPQEFRFSANLPAIPRSSPAESKLMHNNPNHGKSEGLNDHSSRGSLARPHSFETGPDAPVKGHVKPTLPAKRMGQRPAHQSGHGLGVHGKRVPLQTHQNPEQRQDKPASSKHPNEEGGSGTRELTEEEHNTFNQRARENKQAQYQAQYQARAEQHEQEYLKEARRQRTLTSPDYLKFKEGYEKRKTAAELQQEGIQRVAAMRKKAAEEKEATAAAEKQAPATN